MAKYTLSEHHNNGQILTPGSIISYWKVSDPEGDEIFISSKVEKIIINETKNLVTIFLIDEDKIIASIDEVKDIISIK